MNHFIQKSILFGVGVYSKAQKELERSVKGLIKKNKISRKEGEAVLESFVKSSKTAQAKMEREVKRNVTSFAKRVTLAKQKDLVALEKRLKSLEAQISSKISGKKKPAKKAKKAK